MTFPKRTHLMSIAGVVLLATAASMVLAGPRGKHKKHDDKAAAATAKVGSPAPDFMLKDTDGKDVKLADLTKAGKIVVLEWFNPGCPFIKLHHEKQTTMADLYKDFNAKNVVFLAVNSTSKSNPDFGKDAEAKKKWKIEYQILPDADGKVGHTYGAATTPHMFVIDAKGVLAYKGAMDNDPRMEKKGAEKVNYVRNALNDLIAGKKVATPETKSYGCSVKY